jgi:hypothetical protein
VTGNRVLGFSRKALLYGMNSSDNNVLRGPFVTKQRGIRAECTKFCRPYSGASILVLLTTFLLSSMKSEKD